MNTNREIKFRGKRIDNGNWVYGYYFKTPLTSEINTEVAVGLYFLAGNIRHCIANEYGVVFEVNPEPVGQYTGLKDKNGKDIYEGDIVHQREGDNYNWVVVFDTRWKAWTYYLDGEMNSYMFNTDYHEVVGNIYENPELLEGENK